MAKRRHRGQERKVALERIEILFRLAEEEARLGHGPRSKRYVTLARRIGMRYNVSVPPGWKRRFCRACNAFFVPPANARVRVGRGRVVVTCLACGAIQRVPLLREKAASRRKAPAEPQPLEAQ